MSVAIQSFSLSHNGIAIRNERQPRGRARGIGLEQTVELDQRLLVEADQIELLGRDAGSRRQYATGPRREVRIVLLAR
jgi:hypothetical protein